ncbi:M28 family peptidase [Sphingomicrobium flavum]|uniref:M28 family peptidase n=1 Tax=Sphingomicrobium flavum TaxID=1229164 RepID=UPI0021ADF90A|nr:M28 family peptidase [Sphingomicrobium flavum]
MKLPLLIGAAALAFSVPALAQSAPSLERIEADTTILSADEMGGRELGSEGYDKAAAYVAAQMAAMGLKPGGDGQTYLQAITLAKVADHADAPPSMRLGRKTLVHGEDVIIETDPALGAFEKSYDLVYVGDGFDAPQFGSSAYGDVDVRGKIVVISAFFLEKGPADVLAHINQSPFAIAAANGAAGLMMMVPQGMPDDVWNEISAEQNGGGINLADAQGVPVDKLDGLEVAIMLNPKVNADLLRGTVSPMVIDQGYMTGKFPPSFAIKERLDLSATSTSSERIDSANVIGMIEGSDPALADEVIVVTAHLDHVGTQSDHEGEDKIFNGAFDNAIGVASMLEAARMALAADAPPRRSIAFVALGAEEQGLFGSAHLAKAGNIAGKRIVANVNLDMPLTFVPFDRVIAFGAEHSTIGEDVAAVARDMGLKIMADPQPDEAFFVRSDHYSFVKEGIPSVMLDVWPAKNGAAVNKRFMENHYHDPSDEVGIITDWKPTGEFARLNALLIQRLAAADAAPLWYEDSYFGTTLAPRAPKARRAQ